MRRVALGAMLALGLALASPASAARFAVGVDEGASVDAVARAIERSGLTPERHLAKLRALVVDAPTARGLRALRGVAYVERLDRPRRVAFTPNDPLAPRQWHLSQVRAFDFWPELPTLAGVRVAVIDSGIDGSHPDFQGRIAASRTFVGGSALTDQQGHGTFVAGLIAAQTNNELGVAGIAFPAQLVIAKVVRSSRLVSLEAEAAAIRWAVDEGARVINLSLGGLRDPRDIERDT
ncbi:MAG TPA: S8 family serine peptidase, partial [Gaiellaceae bacterium]|nr:S8 family serine peptidase [Gaiellaceae bacterium]